MEDTSPFGREMAAHRARWEAGDHRRLCALCQALEPSEANPDWADLPDCDLFGACPKCSERKRLSVKDKITIASCVSSDPRYEASRKRFAATRK